MSIIDKLLVIDVKKFELPEEEIEIERLSRLMGEKFVVKIKAIDGQTISDIQRMSISLKKGQVNDIDMNKMKINIIIHGVIDPKLNNPELMKHFKVNTAEELINKLFLAGEQDNIYNKINKLSGYDAEVEEEIKKQ